MDRKIAKFGLEKSQNFVYKILKANFILIWNKKKKMSINEKKNEYIL